MLYLQTELQHIFHDIHILEHNAVCSLKTVQVQQLSMPSIQGRIIRRRDWASALGHQPIGGHQVIKIMTRPLKYFSCIVHIILLEEMQMHM